MVNILLTNGILIHIIFIGFNLRRTYAATMLRRRMRKEEYMSHTGYALGVNCGITFAGLKPASLFWLRDEQCTDMPYYRRLFGKRDFRFITVRSVRGRKLYYVFNRKMLQGVLSDPNIGNFLRSLGYSDTSLGGALGELRRRLEGEGDFPHEVGLFLGYPLEDVEGFIRDARGGICLSCGYWKVYGCPEGRARLFSRYNRCSQCIVNKMLSGIPLERIFKLQ